MPREWKQTKLGNVLSLSNGKPPHKRTDKSPYPIYGSNGIIGFTQETNADAETIVIGRVGSHCGSVYFSKQKCWITDNAIQANALSDNDARFLFYLLKTLNLNTWRTGSGQPLLNQTILSSIPVLIPAPPEQRAIAHVLGTLDDKIELLRRMSETLEEMARAIFKGWFVDFVPVRAKMEGRWKRGQSLPGLPAYLYDLFPDRLVPSELGEIPEGWEVQRFADVVARVRESINPSESPEFIFKHFSIPAFDSEQWPYAEAGADIKSQKWMVPPGSILLSKLNPEVERVWLVDVKPGENAVCSTEFMVLQPQHSYGRAYIYCLIRSPAFRETLKSLVTGTSKSHQRVRETDILNILVLKPQKALASAFEQGSGPLLERALQGRRESHTLAALRDATLPKLIHGEIRVKDAE